MICGYVEVNANVLYLVVGVALLLAVILSTLLEKVAFSAPMVLVGHAHGVSATPALRWLEHARLSPAVDEPEAV